MSDGGLRALSRPCQVLPLGFSAFERKTLATVFRLAEQRAPAYVWCDDELDADLVLLDKDPLQNIRNTKAIWAVIQAGKLYNRKALDAILEGSVQRRGNASLKLLQSAWLTCCDDGNE